MKKAFYILLATCIATSLLLVYCDVKHEDNYLEPPLFSPKQPKKISQLLGKWKYTNTIWHSSELTLAEDGTFTFHNLGCHGQRFSQGKWSNATGIILLTSFDSFKDLRQTQHKTKAVTSLPGPSDTINVYFNNVQMTLKDDTLYCIAQDKFPEEAAFHRATKEFSLLK